MSTYQEMLEGRWRGVYLTRDEFLMLFPTEAEWDEWHRILDASHQLAEVRDALESERLTPELWAKAVQTVEAVAPALRARATDANVGGAAL